jgi:hypothetical protein
MQFVCKLIYCSEVKAEMSYRKCAVSLGWTCPVSIWNFVPAVYDKGMINMELFLSDNSVILVSLPFSLIHNVLPQSDCKSRRLRSFQRLNAHKFEGACNISHFSGIYSSKPSFLPCIVMMLQIFHPWPFHSRLTVSLQKCWKEELKSVCCERFYSREHCRNCAILW